MAIPLKSIIFPGNMRQPCEAEYGIHLYADNMIGKAHIVVIQSDKTHEAGTSLWNADEGRNVVLNKILSNELRGVRVEFVRFSVALDMGGDIRAIELPILLDFDDFVAKGNPHNLLEKPAENIAGVLKNFIGKGEKDISVWSGNVVGGSARFYTDFERRKHLPSGELKALLQAVGYVSDSLIV
jgi:hypothetical protein